MQRRLAAVLFADIVGFTELSARDERGSLAAIQAFEASARAAVTGQGGQVVKFMGDGVLAHFPSTEASIRAGLALVRDFDEATAAQRKVRVGIHVGDILIRDDGDVLGDGVNTASRLQSVASPGQVVVSDEVWRQIRHVGDFDFKALGAKQLKGVPERRAVYAVSEGTGGVVPIGTPRSRRRLALAVTVAAAAIAAFVVLRALPPVDGPDAPEVPVAAEVEAEASVQSLVVLPFDDLSGNPDEAWLVSGMHDALIGELTELGALRVISRTSAVRYQGTTLSLEEIARELDVDAVVAASVLRSGGNIRIRAELIRVFPREQSIWAGTFDREMQDVLVLYSDVAKALADAISLRLTPGEQARLARGGQVNPDAYNAYLRGRFHWGLHTSGSLERAMRYFELALEADPGYAPAYAGIASVWYARRQRGLVEPETSTVYAKAAALRALELDPHLASAHQALAVEYAWHDWNWDASLRHFERALELNPGDALTRAFYSLVLRIVDRPEEGLHQARTALSRDPFNPIVRVIVGGHLANMERYDEAITVTFEGIEHDPDHPVLLRDLAFKLQEAGRFDESIEFERRYFESLGDSAMTRIIDGTYDDPRAVMAAIADEFVARRETEWVPPMYPARYYMFADDPERTLYWFERAVAERDHGAAFLGNPIYRRRFGDEPRYIAVLDALGLR